MKVTQRVFDAIHRVNKLNARVADWSSRWTLRGWRELAKAAEFNAYLWSRALEGGVLPAMHSAVEIGTQVGDSLAQTLAGERPLSQHVEEMSQRARSAVNYDRLVRKTGKQLFGSARFQGETRLAETEYFTLSYIPPRVEIEPRLPALFHAGGYLPFSDRIFRILPEANLFNPFVERGMPVYAVELRGPRKTLKHLPSPSLARIVEMLDELAGVAREHHGKPLILEGYCGLAIPVLAYLCARPKAADAKFNVAFVMVAPVDGRHCEVLRNMITAVPRSVLATQYLAAEALGGHLHGAMVQGGIDLALNTFLYKTAAARLAAGWQRNKFAGLRSAADLDFKQRREIAGAYWVSSENSSDYPLPMDLVRVSTEIWRHGLKDDHLLPYEIDGRKLSLRAIRDETRLRLAGFYGGKDIVVPEATAAPLIATLGDRYTHVVHPDAGHISYVLSPEIWDKQHPGALDPCPIDLVLDLYRQVAAERAPGTKRKRKSPTAKRSEK